MGSSPTKNDTNKNNESVTETADYIIQHPETSDEMREIARAIKRAAKKK